jgi:UDP-glucuronate 4-epimerase
VRVLVTGAAGHIGAQVVKMLLDSDSLVRGVDSFTDFYSVEMKKSRVHALGVGNVIRVGDISDSIFLEDLFTEFKPTHVVHLAARAGVRSNWNQFDLYNQSNILGFHTLLTTSLKYKIEHFLFASSSSVYGEGLTPPYRESAILGIPKSYYALTKLANEITASSASSEIKTTGLRFFTVYGPWGRPDMATLQFIASGILGRTATLTGDLGLKRDFTYVSDAAQAVIDLLDRRLGERFEILNIAGGRPQSLGELLQILSESGLEVVTNGGSLSDLDVPLTHGSTEKLANFVPAIPSITLREGLNQVIDWARSIPTENLAKWVVPPSIK